MQKTTLVLEGGATRGVFTSGVLDYLMEKEVYTSHVMAFRQEPAMQWTMYQDNRDGRETV